MSNANRELQLRKTCKLYAYVLSAQGKEVPEAIQECADSDDFDDLVDCVKELSQTIKGLDSQSYEKILNDTQSAQARDLAQWWEMYQIYVPLD